MPSSPKTFLRELLQISYGIYTVAAFVALGTLALLLTSMPFPIRTRRRIAHRTAQAFFRLAALPVQLVDPQHLPQGPCVVVANHASYLDGIVLKAALPARFSFVIKKEFSRVPLAGLLLRRIGSEFVDRFNRHAGGLDARRLLKAADAGQALVFFPEGTFLPEPGLGKFHTGAFAIAARANLPVVPVAINGTRAVLPSGRLLPRTGRIEVRVLPAIGVPARFTGGELSGHLRDEARARILAAIDEPDLIDADGLEKLRAARSSP